jgi:hypothetical protein
MSLLTTIRKALLGKEDITLGVGTVSRATSTGGTTTINKVGAHTFTGFYSLKNVVAFDGETNVATALNSLIDTVYAEGGGVIDLPAGTGLVTSTIVLKSGVILRGQGKRGTTLKLAADVNLPVVESYDFAGLTGQALSHENAVPTGFGLINLRIDGNRDNQDSTPSGVRFYGKWFVMDDVQIINAAGIGFQSEMGGGGGTGFTSTLEDDDETPISPEIIRNEPDNQAESRIKVEIRRSGGIGMDWKGPHDAIFESLIVAGSGSDGVVMTSLTGSYEASCDIKFAHIYANNGIGFHAMAVFRADHLIVESNYKQGLLMDEFCPRAQLGIVQAYRNNWYGGFGGQENLSLPSVHIRTTTVTISNLVIEDDFGGGGLVIEREEDADSGNNLNQVANCMINGKSTAATGITIRGNSNYIRGTVFGYTADGGTALHIDHEDGTRAGNRMDLYLAGDILFKNDGGNGKANRYHLNGAYESATQTAFSGNYPATADDEDWSIYFYDSTLGEVDRVWSSVANFPHDFTDGDTTPSVRGATVFRTDNSTATTITDFDDAVAGQEFIVIFGDNNTTIDFTGTDLKGNNGVDFTGNTTDVMWVVYGGTNFLCDVSDNTTGRIMVKDGITAPAVVVGEAQIYVDTSDGDLKVKFGDGTIKTIVVDT